MKFILTDVSLTADAGQAIQQNFAATEIGRVFGGWGNVAGPHN